MDLANITQNRVEPTRKSFNDKLNMLLGVGSNENHINVNDKKNQALILMAIASLGLTVGFIVSLLF